MRLNALYRFNFTPRTDYCTRYYVFHLRRLLYRCFKMPRARWRYINNDHVDDDDGDDGGEHGGSGGRKNAKFEILFDRISITL